jgi:hypothetical protein
MDRSNDEVRQHAEADRRVADPPIEVEAVTPSVYLTHVSEREDVETHVLIVRDDLFEVVLHVSFPVRFLAGVQADDSESGVPSCGKPPR